MLLNKDEVYKHTKELPRLETIIRLFRMVRPVRGKMILAILFGTLNHLSNIALVTYGAYLIASIFVTNESITAIKISLLFILAIVKAISSYLEQTKNHDVAFRLLAQLRTDFYKQLEPIAPAKLIDKRSGDIISTIGGDIELIEVFFAHTISPIILAIIVESIVLVFLGFIWILLPFVLIGFQLILNPLILVIWDRVTRNVGQEIQEQMGETNAHLTDAIQGIKTILLFNQGKNQTEKIIENSRTINEIKQKHSQLEGLLYGIIGSVILAANITMVFVAINGYQNQILTITELVVVIAISISCFGPLLSVSSVSHHLTKTFAAANRLFKIVDEAPAVIDTYNCSTCDMLDSFEIEFKNVNFKYSNNGPYILRDFNLKIKNGESIALLGESGIGKSTVLRLLLRFWDYESGEITIGGRNIKGFCQNDLRKNIAVISPESFLFNVTIRENIAIGNKDATLEDIIECSKMANLYDFIMSLPNGFDTNVGEFGDKISGGERQKVLICRALLKNARILLLDEPTNYLDSINERSIQLVLNKIMKEKTVILVTHKLSNLAIVDKCFKLKKGGLLIL